MITADEARELIAYDPETGILTWRKSVPRCKAGTVAGAIAADGYRRISIRRKQYSAHHVAWLIIHGEWAPEQLDHINRVRDDNRLSNLRCASPWQNQANTAKTAKAKGIWWDRRAKKWHAAMKHRGQRIYIGGFLDAADAARAYQNTARKLRGEFYGPRAAEANGLVDGSD